MSLDSEYYRAYDVRYRQVHEKQLRWFSDAPSPIVDKMLKKYGIGCEREILEIGCGEGRDAAYLLKNGYRVTATDISDEAIRFCREKDPAHAHQYAVLDVIHGRFDRTFDFVYAIAVLHMLILDVDRKKFLEGIGAHLKTEGYALIMSMGDGEEEWQSDLHRAFDNQKRVHEQSGTELNIASTSCRVVSMAHFLSELAAARFSIVESGMTAIEPDFPVCMYAVVKKC